MFPCPNKRRCDNPDVALVFVSSLNTPVDVFRYEAFLYELIEQKQLDVSRNRESDQIKQKKFLNRELDSHQTSWLEFFLSPISPDGPVRAGSLCTRPHTPCIDTDRADCRNVRKRRGEEAVVPSILKLQSIGVLIQPAKSRRI